MAFVGENLDEVWARIQGRMSWDLPGEKVDEIIDAAIEDRQLDAEFDALFADDPDELGFLDELESLGESEAFAASLTLGLVGNDYSVEDALSAALLGTFETLEGCFIVPGAFPVTANRLARCRAVVPVDDDSPVDNFDVGGNESSNAESADDSTTPTTSAPAATSGRWSGSASELHESESRTTQYEGSATIELQNGVYSLVFEITSNSTNFDHVGCSTSTLNQGEATAQPEEYGRLLFVSVAARQIDSDCPFYESSGGHVEETTDPTYVGYLLDSDMIRLDLLPQTPIEMAWTPL